VAETDGSQTVYPPSFWKAISGEAMADQLDSNTLLRLLVRTILLTFSAVVGLTVSLCDTPSCGCKVFCAWVGMASGSILFIQIACAQMERYYRGGLGQSSLSA
jgi:hypothetical protein